MSVKLTIIGMTCMSCVNTIESMMSVYPGVNSIKVDLNKEEAIIFYNKLLTDVQALCSAIDDMGFEATIKSNIKTVVVNIQGIKNNLCQKRIEKEISNRNNVLSVSLQTQYIKIDYQSPEETPSSLCEAVCKMGFVAFLLDESFCQSVTLSVEGMTCNSCVNTITEMMSQKPGVISILVSLEKKTAIIDYDSSITNMYLLVNGIEELGFDAFLKESIKGKYIFIYKSSLNFNPFEEAKQVTKEDSNDCCVHSNICL